jgi:acetyl esterase/lipase
MRKSTTALRNYFASAIFIICVIASSACLPQAGQKWLNISYAGDTLTGHRMDIFLPDGKGPFPVVVTIAGSAWFGNNTKDRAFAIGKPLLEKGFAVVAVNHRSSREAIFPAQINDIKAAVRFLRANAKKYSLDVRFIGITGDSSGGHLSALMGTSTGVREYQIGSNKISLEGAVGNFTKESSHVNAVVDWYGPTTFQKVDSCGSTFSHSAPGSPESTLIGAPIQESDDLCALADPITYIDKKDPAFLILHGDADYIVPVCQSIFLDKALKKGGVASELIIVKGGEHGKGMWLDEYTSRMVRFFEGELKKAR